MNILPAIKDDDKENGRPTIMELPGNSNFSLLSHSNNSSHKINSADSSINTRASDDNMISERSSDTAVMELTTSTIRLSSYNDNDNDNDDNNDNNYNNDSDNCNEEEDDVIGDLPYFSNNRNKNIDERRGTRIVTASIAELPPPVRRRLSLYSQFGMRKLNNFMFNLLFRSTFGKTVLPASVFLLPTAFFVMMSSSNTIIHYITSVILVAIYVFSYCFFLGTLNYDVCCILIRTFDFWYIVVQTLIACIGNVLYVNLGIRTAGVLAVYMASANITIFFDAWPPIARQSVRAYILGLTCITQILFVTCVYFNLFPDVNDGIYTLGFVKYRVSALIIVPQCTWLVFNIRYALFVIRYPKSFALYRHRVNSPLRSPKTVDLSRQSVSTYPIDSQIGNKAFSRKRHIEPDPNQKAYYLEFEETSLTQIIIQNRMTLARYLFGKDFSTILWSIYRHKYVVYSFPAIWWGCSIGTLVGSCFSGVYWYYIVILPSSICIILLILMLILLANLAIFKLLIKCFTTLYLFVQILIMFICLADMFAWTKYSIVAYAWFLLGASAFLNDCLPIRNSKYTKNFIWAATAFNFLIAIITHLEWFEFQRDRQLPDFNRDGTYTSGITVTCASACLAYLIRSSVNIYLHPHSFLTLTSRIKSPLLYSKEECRVAEYVIIKE